MNPEEQARRLMVEDRQKAENLQQNMLSRSEQIVESEQLEQTAEKARELLAQDRQEQEHLQETMLARTEEEIS